jgi:hypothetical protein
LRCCQNFELVSAQSRCSCDTSAYVALLLSPCYCRWLSCRTWRHSTATWPSMVLSMQHSRLCWRCAGVLARLLLASLRVLRCCRCWHSTSDVTHAARASLPLSCWRPLSHWTRVAASIANWHLPSHKGHHRPCLPYVTTSIASWHLPSPNAVAPQYPCPHCAGVSAGVALLFSPASHWCHCQSCAVIVAGNMPALLPCCHTDVFALCCTGIFTFVAPMLLPAF